MINITATLINIYHVCHRELWLHANGIRMESGSESVAEGKFIGDTAYPQRAGKYTQIELDGVKIDYFDSKNGVVHEVKKSDKMEIAATAQVKYYLWKLEQNGISISHGIIEYPRLRLIEKVELNDIDRNDIKLWINEIDQIIGSENCPNVIHKQICKNCSYFEYCYANE
jgi:CRISPR-associated exonuclease Cas4